MEHRGRPAIAFVPFIGRSRTHGTRRRSRRSPRRSIPSWCCARN